MTQVNLDLYEIVHKVQARYRNWTNEHRRYVALPPTTAEQVQALAQRENQKLTNEMVTSQLSRCTHIGQISLDRRVYEDLKAGKRSEPREFEKKGGAYTEMVRYIVTRKLEFEFL